MNSFVLKGDICDITGEKTLKTTLNGYAVCVDGVSRGVFEALPEEYSSLPVIDMTGHLVIPGLSDLHIHASQYAYRGLGMDMELMEWLDVNAFPEEARFQDAEYARKAYSIFADQMKRSASTRFCIYATRHSEATTILMDEMEQTGLYSFVGKVNMDREAPDYLREPTAEAAAADTEAWVQRTMAKYKRTKPILTPRFIPSCTDTLMEKLGALRGKYDLPVQSHLSENLGEIDFVCALRPDSPFYGAAYEKDRLFGMDGGKKYPVLMAHCIWPCDEEFELMKKNSVFVAHCPACNMNVSSGIAPIRRYLEAGIPVGLGSDVAGGHTESLFTAIINAIQVSKL